MRVRFLLGAAAPEARGADGAVGLIANFILAIIAVVLSSMLGPGWDSFNSQKSFSFTRVVEATSGAGEVPAQFLSILFSLNLLLGTFNLIPVPPLDGHSAIGLALPEDLFRRWLEFIRSPMLSLLGLIIAWQYFHVVFFPVFALAIRLL